MCLGHKRLRQHLLTQFYPANKGTRSENANMSAVFAIASGLLLILICHLENLLVCVCIWSPCGVQVCLNISPDLIKSKTGLSHNFTSKVFYDLYYSYKVTFIILIDHKCES